jgi:hypothetical protein
MALEDKLAALSVSTRRLDTCSWQSLLLRLNDKDRKSLENALERKIPLSIIVKALRQEGHATSMDSVRSHLKGSCRCQK